MTRTILVRRYLCRRCSSVITVVPREVVSRRHFGATSIAIAFALVGLLGASQQTAWAAVSGWGAPRSTWITLRRWARAVVERRLFLCVRAVPPSWSVARVAERVALTLRAQRPAGASSGSILEDVFLGAAHVAHAT